jgi:hypothetical protein
MTASRTITETADLIGRERYAELTLFQALGERVLRGTEPAFMVGLSGAAQGHAWRVKLLEELLPVSLGLPGVEQATTSPGPEFDAAVAHLTGEPDDFALGEALTKTLYPAMLGAYRTHRDSCDAVSEAPVRLALRRLIADLEVQSEELEALVGSDEGPPRGSAAAVATLFDALGGPFGRIE